jgi:hypothetical protein
MGTGKGKMNVEKLLKADLVKLAADKLKEDDPSFEPAKFSRVRAFQRGNERRVEFSNPVEFVPLNTCAYYAATYHVGEIESTACKQASNPDGFKSKHPRFYQPTADDERVVADILRAMKFQDLDPGDVVTIYDRKSHYEVIHRTTCGIVYFEFDKKSKKFEETKHKDLVQRADPFTEMEK